MGNGNEREEQEPDDGAHDTHRWISGVGTYAYTRLRKGRNLNESDGLDAGCKAAAVSSDVIRGLVAVATVTR
jgi:hypothetical protein